MNKGAKITLYYFNLMARAEISRMILHYNGAQFEDKRIKYDEWKDFKEKNKHLLPFGQVPVLDWNGKIIAQGHVIARFLTQQFGQYPSDINAQTDVEMFREFVNLDITYPWSQLFNIQDKAQKTQFIDNYFNFKLPEKLNITEQWLKKNGSNGHLVGNSVTLADFAMWDLADRFLADHRWKERSTEVFGKFPEVQDYLKK
jgi:glutathione S-transferase